MFVRQIPESGKQNTGKVTKSQWRVKAKYIPTEELTGIYHITYIMQ